MPNINIKNGEIEVENGSNQVHGQPWTVTVPVNNRELFKTQQDHGCMVSTGTGETGEAAGHKADVSVKVFQGDDTVAEGAKRVCAPLDFSPPPDPRPTFGPFDPEPGQYTVRAKVDPVGGGQSDTVERTVNVSQRSDAPPANDGGNNDGGGSGGLPPLGDADGDGTPNMLDPAPQNPDKPAGGGLPSLGLSTTQQAGLAIVAVLVVMMIARPYASLGSEVVG